MEQPVQGGFASIGRSGPAPEGLGDFIASLNAEITAAEDAAAPEDVNSRLSALVSKESEEIQAGLRHAQESLEERFAGAINPDFNDDKKLGVIKDYIVKEFGVRSKAGISDYVTRMVVLASKFQKPQSLLDRCLEFIFEQQCLHQSGVRRRR